MKHVMTAAVAAVVAFFAAHFAAQVENLPDAAGLAAAGVAVLAYGAAVMNSGTVAAKPTATPSTSSLPTQVPSSHETVLNRPAPQAKPTRSDALTLLSALQREARFVDFVKEDVTGATDAQVGAAARGVQRDCAAVLERFFAIRPLLKEAEGSRIDLPAVGDAARYKITGNSSATNGVLQHAGWQATATNLPTWSGAKDTANIISPAEVEAK